MASSEFPDATVASRHVINCSQDQEWLRSFRQRASHRTKRSRSLDIDPREMSKRHVTNDDDRRDLEELLLAMVIKASRTVR